MRWLDARIAEMSKDCAKPDEQITGDLADSLRATRGRILLLGGKK
jgi:hypothetical protein